MPGFIRSTWPLLIIGGSFSIIGTIAIVAIARQALGLNVHAPQQNWQNTLGTFVVLGTFGTFGFLLLSFVGWYWKSVRTSQKLQSKHHAMPWRHRPDWENNLSYHFLTKSAIAYSGLALVTNSLTIGGSAMFLLAEPDEERAFVQISLAIAFTGFIFVTSLLGLYALWIVRDAITLRNVNCQLVGIPFRPGDAVRAIVGFEATSLPKTPITVTLECSSMTSKRASIGKFEYGDTAAFQRVHFQVQFKVDTAVLSGSQNVDLPVRFNLPSRVREIDADNSVSWEIKLHWRSAGGLTHNVEFEIPVYHAPSKEQCEECEKFDLCFYAPNRWGFPHVAHSVSLHELVQSYGGELNQKSKSKWSVRLPRMQHPVYVNYATIIGCTITFLGCGMLMGGISGAIFATLPWLTMLGSIGMHELRCDGNVVSYQKSGFWRRRVAYVNVSEIRSVRSIQQERLGNDYRANQVTAELVSGTNITLLANAQCPMISSAICERLRVVIPARETS